MVRGRPRVTACVITLNEEEFVADCIRSVLWSDEVLVVDSHSTDRTREIARSLGARVIERDWPGFIGQKQFATDAASHDWVFQIDADERVTPELAREIGALREAGFAQAAGWKTPRCSWYLGRWIRHGTWYPDYCLRLFDRRRGRWGGEEPHARFETNGPVRRLRKDLRHYPYRDLTDHLERINRYTSIMAEVLHRRGRRAHLGDVTLRPWFHFVRFYFLKMGMLDGWRGLLLASLDAHYVRLKYGKLLARQRLGEATS